MMIFRISEGFNVGVQATPTLVLPPSLYTIMNLWPYNASLVLTYKSPLYLNRNTDPEQMLNEVSNAFFDAHTRASDVRTIADSAALKSRGWRRHDVERWITESTETTSRAHNDCSLLSARTHLYISRTRSLLIHYFSC